MCIGELWSELKTAAASEKSQTVAKLLSDSSRVQVGQLLGCSLLVKKTTWFDHRSSPGQSLLMAVMSGSTPRQATDEGPGKSEIQIRKQDQKPLVSGSINSDRFRLNCLEAAAKTRQCSLAIGSPSPS